MIDRVAVVALVGKDPVTFKEVPNLVIKHLEDEVTRSGRCGSSFSDMAVLGLGDTHWKCVLSRTSDLKILLLT